MSQIALDTIRSIFAQRGTESYADEPVNQLQHALQSGFLAEQAQSSPSLIVAALLHDIGHLMADSELPATLAEDLHDHHEARAYEWLIQHFGPAVADPARLHVAAKRYLCSTESDYEAALSPTSRKSYYDQGGPMNAEEQAAFRAEPYAADAITLRRWDDQAKMADWETPDLAYFEKYMVDVMLK